MIRSLRPVVLALLLILGAGLQPVSAQLLDMGPIPAKARFELFRQESGAVLAVLWVEPEAGWHTYAHENDEAVVPLEATVQLGPGRAPLRVVYPPGTSVPDALEPAKTVNIHEGAVPVVAALPPDAAGEVLLAGSAKLVLCSDVNCRQGEVSAALDLPALDPAVLPRAEDQPWYPQYLRDLAVQGQGAPPGQAAPPEAAAPAVPGPPGDYSWLAPRFAASAMEVRDIGKAALFALLAGLILNVMPCVLPVASLKFSGFLAASSDDPARRFRDLRAYNIFFALGILTYFLILSVILGLAGMAWGQLFQSTGFILGMAAAVFALSLSLFGLYNLPVIDLKRAPKAAGKVNTKASAYVTGILATLLATPCSGPFLGGVLAWTMLQPVWVITTVFACIGLGMSGPYLLFAVRPELIRFFPKPGPWLEYLEKGVGFVLLATSLYLLSVLQAKYVFPSLFTLLAIAFAAWMWGHWTSLNDPPRRRNIIRGAALALIATTAWLAFSAEPTAQAPWEDFSGPALHRLLGKENVLVDFTADWCPNCKVLEKTVLTPDNRAKWKQKYNLRFLKADLTASNPEAMALLKALKGQSIPVTALFPKGSQAASPLVLRDLYSTARIEDAMGATFK